MKSDGNWEKEPKRSCLPENSTSHCQQDSQVPGAPETHTAPRLREKQSLYPFLQNDWAWPCIFPELLALRVLAHCSGC